MTIPPPPGAAAALYVGTVMHARLRPRGHRFNYRVMNLLIDLDRLDEAGRMTPLLRVNRRGLVSFHERDHGPRDGSSLRSQVERMLRRNGVDLAGGRVLLLCYPRMFGYVFNPLSVYYCYDRDGGLAALIYEVRNTFGEIHHYVCPVRDGEMSPAGLRQEQPKTFYVSPFIDMAMRYRFRMRPPTERIHIHILENDDAGPLLVASFSGHRRPLTTAAISGALFVLPLMTFKVIGSIHLEAARLWLKGMTLYSRPTRPPAPAISHGAMPSARSSLHGPAA